jgi:hypothetical protein
MDKLSVTQKMLATFLVGLLLGAGGTWLWFNDSEGGSVATDEEGEEVTDENGDALIGTGGLGGTQTGGVGGAGITVSGEGSVAVLDQAAGASVLVESASLPVLGWVAIHEDMNGAPGWILGARRLEAGSATAVEVPLLRGTTAGGTYYAVIHADNGDRAFDPHTDLPVATALGSMIVDTFMAQ